MSICLQTGPVGQRSPHHCDLLLTGGNICFPQRRHHHTSGLHNRDSRSMSAAWTWTWNWLRGRQTTRCSTPQQLVFQQLNHFYLISIKNISFNSQNIAQLFHQIYFLNNMKLLLFSWRVRFILISHYSLKILQPSPCFLRRSQLSQFCEYSSRFRPKHRGRDEDRFSDLMTKQWLKARVH